MILKKLTKTSMKQSLINQIIFNGFTSLKTNSSIIRHNLIIFLLSIIIGVITGNIFGSFLFIIRNYLKWDGFIILLLLLFNEAISSVTYVNEVRKNLLLIQFINWLKIGFFLGIYLDAFKVGS
jgi:hypothetical protein